MIYLPVWKDTFYTASTSGEPLEYLIQSEESGNYTVLYTGKAYPAPGELSVSIPINRIVRDYLDNNLPDSWPSLNSYDNTNALVHFQITDGTNILEDYCIKYDWSYNEWSPSTASTEMVSDPIDSAIAEGMYKLETYITTALTSMTTSISTAYTGGEIGIMNGQGKYLNSNGYYLKWGNSPQDITLEGDYPGNFTLRFTGGGYLYASAGDDLVHNGSYSNNDYFKWKVIDNAIINKGKTGETYSISSIPDGDNVQLDTMGLPMTLVSQHTKACGRYAVYYLQPNGGWSQYLFQGKTSMRTDEIERHTLTKVSRNTDLSFSKVNYSNDIRPTFELVTGFLNEEQAWKIANYLIPSRKAYLHDLCEGWIMPVNITSDSAEYKDRGNQKHKKIFYTIQAEASKYNNIR